MEQEVLDVVTSHFCPGLPSIVIIRAFYRDQSMNYLDWQSRNYGDFEELGYLMISAKLITMPSSLGLKSCMLHV